MVEKEIDSGTFCFGVCLLALLVLPISGCGRGGGPDGTLPANWPVFKLPVMIADHQVVVGTVSQAGGVVTSATIQGGGLGAFTLAANGNLLVDTYTQIETLFQEHSSDVYANYFGTLHDNLGLDVGWIDVWSGGFAAGTQYAEFGTWELIQVEPYMYAVYAGGNNTLTPQISMPTGTTPTYVGKILGEVFNLDSNTTHQLTGDVLLSANFATGILQVDLTGLKARNEGNSTITAFNDVQMTLNISGNAFTGTAIVVAGGTGPAALLATASGQADGNFYGSSAQEIAGVLHLQDAHGNLAIVAFGAK
jgi:hypothetical protein